MDECEGDAGSEEVGRLKGGEVGGGGGGDCGGTPTRISQDIGLLSLFKPSLSKAQSLTKSPIIQNLRSTIASWRVGALVRVLKGVSSTRRKDPYDSVPMGPSSDSGGQACLQGRGLVRFGSIRLQLRGARVGTVVRRGGEESWGAWGGRRVGCRVLSRVRKSVPQARIPRLLGSKRCVTVIVESNSPVRGLTVGALTGGVEVRGWKCDPKVRAQHHSQRPLLWSLPKGGGKAALLRSCLIRVWNVLFFCAAEGGGY